MSTSFTETQRLKPECINCLVRRYASKYPENTPMDVAVTYMQKVLELISKAPKYVCSPYIVRDINAVRMELFGEADDFSYVKQYFNDYMMRKEDEVRARILSSKDPFMMALQCSMIGNYIDFGAMQNVDENYLKTLLDNAHDYVEELEIATDDSADLSASANKQAGTDSDLPAKKISAEIYSALHSDLQNGKKLVFLTDNCGEVVLDKLFIEQIKAAYPHLDITVLLRGGAVLNDATMEDAEQIGLTKIARCMGNGNNVAGTWIPELSSEAAAAMNEADVILAKGQANYETMNHCGLNVYYIFLCKCPLFANTFQVPKYTGILINDLKL